MEDMVEKYNELMKKYGLPPEMAKDDDTSGKDKEWSVGRCLYFHEKEGGAEIIHIFYKASDQKSLIAIRAHEELHALKSLGKLKYLLLNPRFVLSGWFGSAIGYMLREDEEGLAAVACMYSLDRLGYLDEIGLKRSERKKDLKNLAKEHVIEIVKEI